MIPLAEDAIVTFAMFTAGLLTGQSTTFPFVGNEWPLTVSRLDEHRVSFRQDDPDSGLSDPEIIFLWMDENWYAVTWKSEDNMLEEDAVKYDEWGGIVRIDQAMQESTALYADIWLRQLAAAFDVPYQAC